MNNEAYAFKVGDKVVLTWLGPDQPDGVVTRINGLKTYPWLYTVSVVLASGKNFTIAPSGLRLASEKASLPIKSALFPEKILPHPATPLAGNPTWIPDDISGAALTEAVTDWERVVNGIESGGDYGELTDEYQHDVFKREYIDALLLAFASLKMPVPDDLAARIASADRRFVDSTVASGNVWQAFDYDPTAFWYYYRWPRQK